MTEQQFKNRTKKAAVAAANLVANLPKTKTADVYGMQLIRSSASVGCNYRSACRGRSDAEMAAKLGIAEEEADESQYWLEMLVESRDLSPAVAGPHHKEFNEIVSMLVASRRTIRDRVAKHGSKIREARTAYGVKSKKPSRKKSSNRQSSNLAI